MCFPGADIVAGVGLSLLSGAASFAAQSQQAKAQNQYQQALAEENNRMALATAEAANESAERQMQQIDRRQSEEDEAAAQAAQDAQIDTLKAVGRAKVSAAEAGVSGVAIQNVLADIERQEAVFNNRLRRNRELGRLQAQEDKEGIRAQAIARANQIPNFIPQPNQGPSFLATALDVGTSVTGFLSRRRFGTKFERQQLRGPNLATGFVRAAPTRPSF